MSSLTNLGQEYALFGTISNGSLANLAVAVRLYASSSTPAKNGTGFTEVANGNGYTTGGWPITKASWTLGLDAGDQRIVLDDIVIQATGGNIPNIGGAYLVDGSNNVLAWWERAAPLTMAPGDEVTLDDLSIKLT